MPKNDPNPESDAEQALDPEVQPDAHEDGEDVAALKAELDELRAQLAAKEAEAAEAPIVPRGVVLLDHPDEKASASFGGVEIVRGEDGYFLVPHAAAEELAAHGFTVVGGAAQPQPDPEPAAE